jgi:hypothetical protein
LPQAKKNPGRRQPARGGITGREFADGLLDANAWRRRGLESMMGFSIRTLRRGAYGPNIDAEAVERDACKYKECHKPRGDPLQSMLTALSGSMCHENSPGSRDVSAI